MDDNLFFWIGYWSMVASAAIAFIITFIRYGFLSAYDNEHVKSKKILDKWIERMVMIIAVSVILTFLTAGLTS